jgi:hypothetical protein
MYKTFLNLLNSLKCKLFKSSFPINFMSKYTRDLEESDEKRNYSDELKSKGYEESQAKEQKKKKNSNELSFDVDLDRYDSKGQALQDSDIFPLKTAIPRRKRPHPIIDEDFFGDEENDDSKESENYSSEQDNDEDDEDEEDEEDEWN